MNLLSGIFSFDLTTCLLVIVVFLVSRWFFTRDTNTSGNHPPGPRSLPIVGCLLSLPDTDFRKAVRKLAAKYGDVMQLDMGPRRVVFLNSYDVIKETIHKQGHLYWERPLSVIPDYQTELGVSRLNKTWSEQRRFILHCFRDLGFGKNAMESIIIDEVDNLIDEMKKLVNWPFDPNDTVGKVTANIILRLAFGKRYAYDDPNLTNHIQLFQDITTKLEKRNFSSSLPLIGRIFDNQLEALFAKAIDFCLKWIKTKKTSMNYEDEPKDFIEAFLKEQKNQESRQDTSFTDKMLAWHLLDLYGAGVDTTASTLTFGIYFMIKHGDIQRQVQEEIDGTIGSHRRPVLQDRVNLPYTEAVISEIQRLADIVPLGVPHSNTQDTTVRGYSIPKGTQIMINHHNVHRDPTIWPDPEKFDPRRFLDDSGKYVKREELIPFGLGRRNCLGENLARAELFLVFAGLMQQFTFHKVDGDSFPDTEGSMGFILHPKPAQIVITMRNT